MIVPSTIAPALGKVGYVRETTDEMSSLKVEPKPIGAIVWEIRRASIPFGPVRPREVTVVDDAIPSPA